MLAANHKRYRTSAQRPSLVLVVLALQWALFSADARAGEPTLATTNQQTHLIGTLIYTTAERNALTGKPSASQAVTEVTQPSASNLRIDGFMRPSAGRPVIWVNGQVESDRVELKPGDDQVIIRVNQSQLERLAPGQSVQQSELGADNSMIIHRAASTTKPIDGREKLPRPIPINPK